MLEVFCYEREEADGSYSGENHVMEAFVTNAGSQRHVFLFCFRLLLSPFLSFLFSSFSFSSLLFVLLLFCFVLVLLYDD